MRHGVAVPIGEQIDACQSWTKTALGPLRSLTAHLRPVRPLTAPGHGVVVGLTTEGAEQMMSGVSVGGQLWTASSWSGPEWGEWTDDGGGSEWGEWIDIPQTADDLWF